MQSTLFSLRTQKDLQRLTKQQFYSRIISSSVDCWMSDAYSVIILVNRLLRDTYSEKESRTNTRNAENANPLR